MKNSLRYMILKEIKYLLESKVDFFIKAAEILETSVFKAAQDVILNGLAADKSIITLTTNEMNEIRRLYMTIGLDTSKIATNVTRNGSDFVVKEAIAAIKRGVGNIDDAAALAFLRNPESLVGALGKARFDAIMAEVLNVVTQAEVDKIARKFVQQNEQSFKTRTPIPQQKIVDFVIQEVKTSFPDLLKEVRDPESVLAILKSPTDGVASLVRREDFVRSAGVHPYNAALQWMQSNVPKITGYIFYGGGSLAGGARICLTIIMIWWVIYSLYNKTFGSDSGGSQQQAPKAERTTL